MHRSSDRRLPEAAFGDPLTEQEKNQKKTILKEEDPEEEQLPLRNEEEDEEEEEEEEEIGETAPFLRRSATPPLTGIDAQGYTHSPSTDPITAHNSYSSAATNATATAALWSGTNKDRDVSTGPLARPFAHSLAPLTRSLAQDSSLCSRPPLRSLVRSLAHFAHSLARGKVNF